jgi:hypothetical protein
LIALGASAAVAAGWLFMRPACLPPVSAGPEAKPAIASAQPARAMPTPVTPAAPPPAPVGLAPKEAGSPEIPHEGTGRPPSSRAARPARATRKAETSVALAPPPAARAPLERIFTLGPTPQNVDVYLDGEKKFAYDTDHKTISVPWSGNHTIELRSPAGCCFSERIDVGPDRPLPPDNIIARKLKWKPARLFITLDPPAPRARVVVKDANARGPGVPARVGEDVSIPFQPTDEPSKEIEIDIDTGESFTSERITVRAGEQSSHAVKLNLKTPN